MPKGNITESDAKIKKLLDKFEKEKGKGMGFDDLLELSVSSSRLSSDDLKILQQNLGDITILLAGLYSASTGQFPAGGRQQTGTGKGSHPIVMEAKESIAPVLDQKLFDKIEGEVEKAFNDLQKNPNDPNLSELKEIQDHIIRSLSKNNLSQDENLIKAATIKLATALIYKEAKDRESQKGPNVRALEQRQKAAERENGHTH